jgi:hypothetical protein
MSAWHNIPDKFTTMQEPNGDFEIALRPRHPDDGVDGYTYVYRDETCHFAFIGNANTRTKVAFARRARKVDGVSGPVRLTEAEEEKVKDNINRFFRTRNFLVAYREVEPDSMVDTIKFDLGVVR